MSRPVPTEAPSDPPAHRSGGAVPPLVRVVGLVGLVALVVLVALVSGAVGFALGDRDPGRPMMGDQSADASSAERDFLADMTAHHEEAIAMAEQLQRSDRPVMRAFGARIVRSQTAQVEQMRAWSEQWYGAASLESDYLPSSRDLTGLEGDDLDEAFLADMVPHHMSAVMMSRHLLARDASEHQQVADLATDIVQEQSAEITQMRRWLRDWYDEGVMPGGTMMGSFP